MNDPHQPIEDVLPPSGFAPVVLGAPETSGIADAYRWTPDPEDS